MCSLQHQGSQLLVNVLVVGTKHFADIRGAAVAYYGLARALRDRGHDVTFVQTARPEDRLRLDGVRHVYYDTPRKSLYPLLFALRPVRSYDIIHAHDEAGAYLALRHRVRSLPLVVQFQPGKISQRNFKDAHWRWRYNEIAARFAPRFMAPSQWIADGMIERFGIDPERFHAIHYGIGAAWFDAYRPKDRASGPVRIVLINMKGTDTALRGLAKAAAGGDATLELYGFDKDEQSNRALARELGVADRVSWEGFVRNEELAERVADADIFLSPTLADGFGQVLGEAAALGLPAIANDIDAIPEVVEDGVTGILCPPNDDVAFAEALARLIRDEPLRIRMGKAARERADRLWRWDHVVERIENEVYAPLLRRA
jgi:glycosyltransferase involved in cell wall biosynthesis